MRAVVLSLFLCGSAAWDDLVLPPPADKTGPSVALLFGQGAGIATDLYAPLAAALQAAAPFPLWFASPQCPDNVAAIPGGLEKGMTRVKEALAEQGCDLNATTVFYGGHSLGGAMMPSYVQDHALDDAKGQILMGSFLTREFKTGSTTEGRPQVVFPVPTLTIGGELDGLCRLTRIAEALYSQVTFSSDPAAAQRSLPVTVIEGMNHYEFASGDEPPKFVALNDLKPEIDEATAHDLVAADAVAFMSAVVFGLEGDSASSEQAWAVVAERADASEAFVQPIVDALLMEGYMQFTPPCYCEAKDEYFKETTQTQEQEADEEEEEAEANGRSSKLPYRQFGTCVTQPNCTGGVPWTGQFAMPTMANVGGVEGLSVAATDSLHVVTEETPSCHLPHIHGGADQGRVNFQNPGSVSDPKNSSWNPYFPPLCPDGPDNGCELNVTTITQHIYENAGEVDLWRISFSVPQSDTGFRPIAAREFKSKLKSRESVYAAAGVDPTTFDTVSTDYPAAQGGTGDRCAEINQAAIDWAYSKLPAATAQRFDAHGQKLVVGPDVPTCAGGPCWIWDPLRWDVDDDNNQVTVRAPFIVEPNYNKFPCGEAHADADGVKQFIPCPTGFHYCKLLSPARALEWMFVDGLRLNYSAYH